MSKEHLDSLVLKGESFKELFNGYITEYKKELPDVYKMDWDKTKVIELYEWTKQALNQLSLSSSPDARDFISTALVKEIRGISDDSFVEKYRQFLDAEKLTDILLRQLQKELIDIERSRNETYGLNNLYKIEFGVSRDHPHKLLQINFNNGKKIIDNPKGIFNDLYTIFCQRSVNFGSKQKNLYKLKSIALNKGGQFRKLSFDNYKDILEIVNKEHNQSEIIFSKKIDITDKKL